MSKFKCAIKAHETFYRGIRFRSRLEARWAAFFDLAGWTWEYEPFDLEGWSPDFLVSFPCGHSECSGSHELLVEVKPFFSIEEFQGLPCLNYSYGFGPNGEEIPADSSAAFGTNPHVTWWEMSHGAGGGEESIEQGGWVDGDLDILWQQASVEVRFNPGDKAIL